MEFNESWHTVVTALEKIIPQYEEVNRYLSLGYAEKARIYAVNSAEVKSDSRVLDAGIGPASLSKIVISRFNPSMLVGFDVSMTMLKAAAKRLATFDRNNIGESNIQLIRGIFEYLPFQDETFNQVFASFSLRDSLDSELTMKEFHRVCKNNGQLIIIDIGKPDNRILRAAMKVYMHFLVPIFAKLLIRQKIEGNPWSLLAPTYKKLPTNKTLKDHLQKAFGSVFMIEFLFGAIVVLRGQKSQKG